MGDDVEFFYLWINYSTRDHRKVLHLTRLSGQLIGPFLAHFMLVPLKNG
jgi:hypothetical protein